MYAVVRTGGKQYRVEAGTTLVVEKLPGDPGSTVTFDRVLLVGDGDEVTVGTPTVTGATVSATVLGQVLGDKIVVFKFKQKAKYRRRTGHRQRYTQLRVDEISAGGRTVRAEAAPEEPKATRARAAKAQAGKPKAAAKARTSRRKAEAEPVATEEPAGDPQEADTAKPKPAARARRAKAAPEPTPAKEGEAAEDAAPTRKPRTRRAAKPATGAPDEKAAEE